MNKLHLKEAIFFSLFSFDILAIPIGNFIEIFNSYIFQAIRYWRYRRAANESCI